MADYTAWRKTLLVKLTALERELEDTYSKEWCRLPDGELDWKWDAWMQLQNIMNETMTQEIFNSKDNWPEWAKQMWDILMIPDKNRTCRGVILSILPLLN